MRVTWMLSLLCCGVLFGGVARDEGRIADVAAGKVSEARLSWWGFDESDSTAIIREAIASKATTLVVDKMSSPWVTLPVELKGNFTLVFEEGAEWLAKRGEYHSTNACLVTVRGKKNVRIIGQGQGGAFRMWKCDYQQPPYSKAEWRHCLSLLSVENVLVENMLLAESGGDGIYISRLRGERALPYCKDVTIRKCVCDKNHRQGISVIGAVNLLIEDTVLSNTSGTPPQAGIDFEPNNPTEPLANCVVRNCIAENNASDGYTSYLPNMDSNQSGKFSLRYENCIARNNRGTGFGFCTRDRRNRGHVWDGTYELINCTVENSGRHGMNFNVNMTDKVRATVKNLRCVNSEANLEAAKDNWKVGKAPVYVEYANQVEGEVGSTLALENLAIEDTRDIPWLHVDDNAFCGVQQYRISGNVTCAINGKTESITVDPAYLESIYKDRKYREIISWNDSGRVYKVTNGEQPTTKPTMRNRNNGRFWMYAVQGQPLTFKLSNKKHGKAAPKPSSVELRYPSGAIEKLGKLPLGAVTEFTVKSAKETGICTVYAAVGNNYVVLESCSSASGQVQYRIQGMHFLVPNGTLYFRVVENSAPASLRLAGQGTEGLKAEVFGPDGKLFWANDDIHDCVECYLGDAPVSGVWSVKLGRPAKGVFEDCTVSFLGILPYISASADTVPELVRK